jgi:hypothetical protein
VSEPTESLTFLNAIAGLATRLSGDDIAIYSLTYHCLAFGSWELEAGRRRARIRVTWEGKDRHLRVLTAQLMSGSTERHWQLVEEHDFRSRRTDLVQLLGTVHAAITAHVSGRGDRCRVALAGGGDMQPVTMIAVAFLALIALVQLTRFLLGWPLTIDGVAVPVWLSGIAAVIVGGLSALLWRASRR